jgi:hypothetical protein
MWGFDLDDPAIQAKYRATWQFKGALKIISPDSRRRVECEHDLVFALAVIERCAQLDKSGPTSSEQRKRLQKLAKTLRVAIDLAWVNPLWRLRVEALNSFRKEVGGEADYVGKYEVKKGAPSKSGARMVAVRQAYLLLVKYGSKQPGRSREGP